MVRKFFKWIFKVELEKLNYEIIRAQRNVYELEKQHKAFKNVLSNIDVSVDAHEYEHKYSPSCAIENSFRLGLE